MRTLFLSLLISLVCILAMKPSYQSIVGAQALAQPSVESDSSSAGVSDFEASLISEEEVARMMEARMAQAQESRALGSGSPLQECRYISGLALPPPVNTVVLTFDDGPSAGTLPQILSVLEKYSIQATFFWTGRMSMGRDSLLAEAQQKGHIIASHSFSHPNFHTISTGEQTRQVIDTDTILARFMPSGQKFFRYPYGNSTCHANEVLRREGYRIVGWHVDSCDWAFARNGWVTLDQARICGVSPENRSDFVSHVVSSVVKRTGGILLFHDVHQITVRNLESIILRLTERGYSFVSLADQRYRHYLR